MPAYLRGLNVSFADKDGMTIPRASLRHAKNKANLGWTKTCLRWAIPRWLPKPASGARAQVGRFGWEELLLTRCSAEIT